MSINSGHGKPGSARVREVLSGHLTPGCAVVQQTVRGQRRGHRRRRLRSESYRADCRDPAYLEAMEMSNSMCSWLKRHL